MTKPKDVPTYGPQHIRWFSACGTQRHRPSPFGRHLETLIRTALDVRIDGKLYLRAPDLPNLDGAACTCPTWYEISEETLPGLRPEGRTRVRNFLNSTFPHGAFGGQALPAPVATPTLLVTPKVSWPAPDHADTPQTAAMRLFNRAFGHAPTRNASGPAELPDGRHGLSWVIELLGPDAHAVRLPAEHANALDIAALADLHHSAGPGSIKLMLSMLQSGTPAPQAIAALRTAAT